MTDGLFRTGAPMVVRHGKPWREGRPVQMRGWVAAYDGELLVMRRQFRSPGLQYDGLDARQRSGDHGLLELRRGAWVSRRRYLRAGGELIGEQYNVQTPTLYRRGEVRYVDLEIDVAYQPGRVPAVQVQDERELDEAEAGGHIPPEIAAAAREIAAELARRLEVALAEGREVDWDVRPAEGALAPGALEGFTPT